MFDAHQIFVAFDTETTGLDPAKNSIIEIAGARFLGNGQEIARFATLANPGVAISQEVTQIHGIDNSMVARAPDSGHACRQFTGWIGPTDILVAHNASFDVAFLAAELSRYHLPAPKNPVLDTLKCMKALQLKVPNYRLKTLVAHFGLPETGYHRALSDSLHVMGLFMKFLDEARGLSPAKIFEIGGVPNVHDIRSGHLNGHARIAHLSAIIERGEVIIMRYDGAFRGPGVGPRVLPISIHTGREGDHLRAQMMDDGSIREFRLDRIIEILPVSSAGERRGYSI